MSTSWYPAVQTLQMNATHGPHLDFEAWLKMGLGEALEPILLRPTVPPARFAALSSWRTGLRTARGLILAASTIAALSAVSAMAATGSPNPQVWGQRVSAAVETCKQELKPGQHGIGACVSAFARQHPEATPTGEDRGASNAKESPEPAKGSGHPNARPSGTEGPASPNGNGHAYGRTDQATPPGQLDRGTPPGQANDNGTPPGEGKDNATPPGQLKDKPTPPGLLKK